MALRAQVVLVLGVWPVLLFGRRYGERDEAPERIQSEGPEWAAVLEDDLVTHRSRIFREASQSASSESERLEAPQKPTTSTTKSSTTATTESKAAQAESTAASTRTTAPLTLTEVTTKVVGAQKTTTSNMNTTTQATRRQPALSQKSRVAPTSPKSTHETVLTTTGHGIAALRVASIEVATAADEESIDTYEDAQLEQSISSQPADDGDGTQVAEANDAMNNETDGTTTQEVEETIVPPPPPVLPFRAVRESKATSPCAAPNPCNESGVGGICVEATSCAPEHWTCSCGEEYECVADCFEECLTTPRTCRRLPDVSLQQVARRKAVGPGHNETGCSGWSPSIGPMKGQGQYCDYWGTTMKWCFVEPAYIGKGDGFKKPIPTYPGHVQVPCDCGFCVELNCSEGLEKRENASSVICRDMECTQTECCE
eukprot:TRINITY_DN23311_c0_g1_i1.p1 TRINITY_DN23311_c0_g1~~TRINITY_DN23311_c0_g1_i1.p1  ORF type:complete len:427 (+),score=55.29 TRINITY_DN23311_c0_g1_i1:74-1354(+)